MNLAVRGRTDDRFVSSVKLSRTSQARRTTNGEGLSHLARGPRRWHEDGLPIYWIGSRTVLLTTLLIVTVTWKSPPEGASLPNWNCTTSMPTAAAMA